MINKQGLIFLTLTSLILVLSVYYVTMPNELLLTTNSSYSTVKEENNVKTSIKPANAFDTMRSVLNEERVETLKVLNEKLNNSELSSTEKNNVYEEIKIINKMEAMEENIEKIIKKEYDLESFVKVKDDVIEIVINKDKHDTNLAVKIMSLIEKEYPKMYISVRFKA